MLAIVWGIPYIISKKLRTLPKKFGHGQLPFILYFLLGIVGLLVNADSNLDYQTRLIPFLFVPLFAIIFMTNEKFKKKFLQFFIVGCIALLVFLDLWAIYDMVSERSLYVKINGRMYYRFLYTRYTGGGYFSHIYLSSYSVFSIVALFLLKNVNKSPKYFAAIYLLLHLFMLGSRAVVIALLLAGFAQLAISAFKSRKHFLRLIIFTGIVLGLFTSAYIFRDTVLFNRYSQVFEWTEKRDLLLERNNSINKRVKIYVIGASFFDTKSFEIDGTGIVDKAIANRYESTFKDYFSFKTETYNAHNQYIHNFVDWGYLGIFLLISLLFVLFKQASIPGSAPLLFFWIFFVFLLLMESVLIRQRGILLFVFASSLTMANYHLDKRKNS
ncbi:O-antigen ligase family protein [Ulvibacterium sp.]|uniref:O-antigen ligase family protein n=1 Tax=Ulvibacterium sp. TaxID=2665914 RepID=UPI003CC52131